MEWTESLRRTIRYLEEHLLEETGADGAAEAVHLSAFYLQKGFKIMTGYTIGEYIRCRRLYLAALDVLAGRGKIIDLACQYGYDTPESFTKAFRRFHGVSPAQLRREPGRLKVFLPLQITVSIKGGNEMDYTVEKMGEFQLIGFSREFSMDTSYQEIPKFWDEFNRRIQEMLRSKGPEGALEQAIRDYGVGEYGVCVDAAGCREFRYMIAGRYSGGPVPEGMEVYTFPAAEWAKFRCSGPLPGALQAVNTKIFREWLPGNPDYTLARGGNIEWYSMAGAPSDPDYESAVWIPVERR